MFWTGSGPLLCVADRRKECKRTSKNTKNDVLGRVRQGRFMPGKASVTRSVRIEKDADERLRHLAEQGDTSVNTLVNRALRKFVEWDARSEEHTSELQSRQYLVCRLLLEKKKIE